MRKQAMRETVKNAACRRALDWRPATVALLAVAAGCAGGARPVHEAALPPAAEMATAIVDTLPPTITSPAADVTRWSAGQYRLGRHAEAVALLEPWLSAHQDASPAVRAALAVHHEALGQVDEAAAALAPCADDDPAVARARTWLNLRGDGFTTALDDAKRAAELAPDSAADRNNYGIALLYAGRPAEAREAFLAAREMDPALPGALYNLAIVESVYFFDDDSARRWLAAYRRLDDADPDGLFETLGGSVAVVQEVLP
jgi:tetratricopeptide (TPR) repeat protein